MLYNNLDSIPMAQFIEVLCGNLNALIIKGKESPESLKKKAKELRYAYYSIVNGKETKSKLYSEDQRMKAKMRLYCLDHAENMIKTGHKNLAVEIMIALEYSCTEDNVGKRIASARRELEYLMARIEQADKEKDKAQSKNENLRDVRQCFTRERAFLMTYHKMYIDIKVMSAAEYASILSLTDREINMRLESLKRK